MKPRTSNVRRMPAMNQEHSRTAAAKSLAVTRRSARKAKLTQRTAP